MAIARVKIWQAGDQLDAVDLENEFNNLADNVLAEPFTATQQVDLNGQLLLLDSDGNTLLDGSTNDTIDITIAGADDFRLTANTFTALAGSSIVVTQGALTVTDGQTTLADNDSRTNTVATPLIVAAETSGVPAAGIGTGILFKAESADEAPSSFGQLEVVASDVGTGSEDTYFQMLLRVAGAALTAAYRWAATTANKAIFTHANSADRTYTLPNADWDFFGGTLFKGPLSCGTGSTRSHEGVFTSATGNLSGIHYYSTFSLSSGHTLTVPAGKKRLIIVASTSITIAGTITAVGAGGAAGMGEQGGSGTDQPGGGGGSTSFIGGSVYAHNILLQAGGATGANGTAGTSITGSDMPMPNPFMVFGGAGGSSPGGGSQSGAGGGSIVLIAPSITIEATAVLNSSGSPNSGVSNEGGGGGAGNIYIYTRSYTDNGGTFTMSGGAATGGAPFGGSGADGVKQINIYG